MLKLIPIIPLIIASIEDLKKKEVSDSLNYTMILISSSLILLDFFNNFNFNNLINRLLSFIFYLGISYLFLIKKFWGGGDLKITLWLSLFFSKIRDAFLYFIILMISGGIIGGLYSVYMVIKNRKRIKIENLKKKSHIIFLTFPFIIISIFLGNYLMLLLYLFILILFISTVVSEDLFIVERSVNELVEGDWLAEDIIYNGKVIISKEKPYIDKEDIELLKKLKIKKVKIREGIPFVPAFLISYIIYLLYDYFI